MEIRGCLPPFLSPFPKVFPVSPRKPEPALGRACLLSGKGAAGRAAALPSREPRAHPRDRPLQRTRALPHHSQVPWQRGFCLTTRTAPSGPRGCVHKWPPPPAAGASPPPRDAGMRNSRAAHVQASLTSQATAKGQLGRMSVSFHLLFKLLFRGNGVLFPTPLLSTTQSTECRI